MKVEIYIILNEMNRVQFITLDFHQACQAILNAPLSLTTKTVELDYLSESNWREEESQKEITK